MRLTDGRTDVIQLELARRNDNPTNYDLVQSNTARWSMLRFADPAKKSLE
jgi:hypothetical protein